MKYIRTLFSIWSCRTVRFWIQCIRIFQREAFDFWISKPLSGPYMIPSLDTRWTPPFLLLHHNLKLPSIFSIISNSSSSPRTIFFPSTSAGSHLIFCKPIFISTNPIFVRTPSPNLQPIHLHLHLTKEVNPSSSLPNPNSSHLLQTHGYEELVWRHMDETWFNAITPQLTW